MSYFPPAADENDLPTLRLIRETFGFLPNSFRAQTMRPDVIDAEVQLIGAILVKEGALTRQQKSTFSWCARRPI